MVFTEIRCSWLIVCWDISVVFFIPFGLKLSLYSFALLLYHLSLQFSLFPLQLLLLLESLNLTLGLLLYVQPVLLVVHFGRLELIWRRVYWIIIARFSFLWFLFQLFVKIFYRRFQCLLFYFFLFIFGDILLVILAQVLFAWVIIFWYKTF